ncbi:hypothetical protein ACFWH4_19725 [Streptomyces sp. NPDC127091]|uniref:Uncharacterized protein n=1 Tax=Streptomyces cathayae TaxID=3031124 RepID=A0ABY8K5B6_9ACTN|nr:hypothetical protein [Streptomyces sp. HUAS 5]WGD42614.1 hypothetical protein PYS65_22095 [Streptomyces sp. HUAS 5]
MSEMRKKSVTFAVMGCVAFLMGIVGWAVWGRFQAMGSFMSSAVIFAGAWLFERFSESPRDT